MFREKKFLYLRNETDKKSVPFLRHFEHKYEDITFLQNVGLYHLVQLLFTSRYEVKKISKELNTQQQNCKNHTFCINYLLPFFIT